MKNQNLNSGSLDALLVNQKPLNPCWLSRVCQFVFIQNTETNTGTNQTKKTEAENTRDQTRVDRKDDTRHVSRAHIYVSLSLQQDTWREKRERERERERRPGNYVHPEQPQVLGKGISIGNGMRQTRI